MVVDEASEWATHSEVRHDVKIVSHYELNAISYLIQLCIPPSTGYLHRVNVNSNHYME